MLMTLAGYGQQVLAVKKNDAQSLLAIIQQANEINAAADAKRLYVIIPDGFYDLGKTVLTQITGHNIAFIGQYFQDLTLKNALDYYACGAAGRAVTLHDKGTQTICNRVRLLSYQDTYYSDNVSCQHYFVDSEIHGTVDFICGAGDVWFERCRIVTEKRTQDGSNYNVIAAPRTSKTVWGYIFNNCTIENMVSKFHYARAWHTVPRCTWLHTKLLTPEKLMPTRFEEQGIRTVEVDFKEYQTVDAEGNDITPKSNVVTFLYEDERKALETIMTDKEAKQFTPGHIFRKWNPVKLQQQTERESQKIMKRLTE